MVTHWEITAHSAYNMFPSSWYLIVNLKYTCTLVSDNGYSQLFCNCLNADEIFPWHKRAFRLLQNVRQNVRKLVKSRKVLFKPVLKGIFCVKYFMEDSEIFSRKNKFLIFHYDYSTSFKITQMTYLRQNPHYENLPMQYTVISKVIKNETFR